MQIHTRAPFPASTVPESIAEARVDHVEDPQNTMNTRWRNHRGGRARTGGSPPALLRRRHRDTGHRHDPQRVPRHSPFAIRHSPLAAFEFGRSVALLVIAFAVGAGCGVRSQDDVVKSLDQSLQQRVGVSAPWNPTSSETPEADTTTRELLAQPLTVDAAVRVALLNNRNLRAAYEELGIAHAELQQAARAPNPELEGSVRFPPDPDIPGDPLSPRVSTIDLDVSLDVLSIGLMGSRKKLATAQLEKAQWLAIETAVDLVAQVKSAHYETVSASQILEMRRAALHAAESSLDAMKRMHEAGNVRDLDLAQQQVLQGEATLKLADADAELVQLRERLTVLLGVPTESTQLALVDRLPDLPAAEPAPGDLESRAVAVNPALAAATQEVKRRSQALSLQSTTSWFPQLRLGGHAERESEGEWTFGPSIVLAIPILDQGQGRVAQASAELRQAEQRRAALELEVRGTVRAARSRLDAARARVEYIGKVVVPLRAEIVKQTQLEYNAMQVGVLELLEAKQAELDAGRDFIEALKQYWLARAALERTLGGITS